MIFFAKIVITLLQYLKFGEYMIKKIIQIGNSWGVIIPSAILSLLKINPVTDKVEFMLENDKLIIKKAQKESI